MVVIVASITMIAGFASNCSFELAIQHTDILSVMRQGFSNEVRYFGIFLATMGVHANTPAILAFNQTNTLDSAQRAASAGILIGCGAMGSIIGSLIFRGEDGKPLPLCCYVDVRISRHVPTRNEWCCPCFDGGSC